MKKENSFKCIKNTPALTYIKGEVYSDDLCALLPEYFAPYLFTTHDNVSIYENDKYWIWQPRLKDLSEVECFSGPQLKESIGFSTRQAAEAYLKELNKPKYQSGKVYKYQLGAMNMYVERGRHYGFNTLGVYVENNSWFEFDWINNGEATPEEWQTALIKEAERRYKVGDKYIQPDREKHSSFGANGICGKHFIYMKYDDGEEVIFSGGYAVYVNGIWATVIPEPKAKLYCNVYEGVDHAVIRPSIQECELAYGKLEITTQKYLGIYELIKIK